jgi:hypothetical protein
LFNIEIEIPKRVSFALGEPTVIGPFSERRKMTDESQSVPEAKPEEVEPKEPSPSESVQEGEDEKKEDKAPLKLPDKFKDKSVEEIVKSYGELERKLGEQGASLKELKQLKQDRDILAKAITSDQELYKKVEAAVLKESGQTDTKTGQDGDGEAGKTDPQVAELRRTAENRAINDFTAKHGLNDLEPEKRKETMKKVGQALSEMVDPGGTKNTAEIMSSIRLDKLPAFLENAYVIAHKDAYMDKGSSQTQDTASIGRMSSSGKSGKPVDGLTDRERAVSEKLGIKPEEYAKQKEAMKDK